MAKPASPDPREPVEVLIYDRTEEWMRLWNSGQFEACMELYARDALYLPAHHDPIFGRANISEYLHPPLRQGSPDFKLETEFIQLAGNLVYDVGRYSVSVLQPDGSHHPDRGRYLVVWVEQEPADWRILVFAAWSSEQPWARRLKPESA